MIKSERLRSYAQILVSTFSVLVLSCSKDTGAFYMGSLDIQNPKIIVASQVAAGSAIVMYDLQGNLQRVLHDYATDGANSPRALVPISPTEFFISVEGIDHVARYSITEGMTYFVTNSNFTGNIFGAAKHPDYGLFVVESNTIEAFDLVTGERSGNPRIPATVGLCVLNVPRGITFNQAGQLVVVNTGNDRINVYDVSDPTNPVCVRTNTSLGAVDPITVLAHSDGFLYVGTQGDDRIYRFAGDGSGTGTTVFNDLATINNPSALAEMPDGSLLVASDGTNAIVNIRTNGTIVTNTNFIQDAFTNSVSDIIILQETTR